MPKIIAVMSGKGGVGKTSVAVMIARILAEKHKTILLDFDICGPSTTTALGVTGSLIKTEKGFQPVKVIDGLDILSFGLVLKPDDAVIWRGPKKLVFLENFFNSAENYEYIVIDTPPGISEEHSFLINKSLSAIIITTPQNVALNDAQRCIEFCLQNQIPVIGLLENMHGLKCECCNELFYPFGSKGGQQLAQEYSINFLGSLPIEPEFSEMLDDGSFKTQYSHLYTSKIIRDILLDKNKI